MNCRQTVVKPTVETTAMNDHYYILEFERAADPELEMIPMIVRMKLDIACCRISLSQWQQLSPAVRAYLVDTQLVDPQNTRHFRQYLDGALREAGGAPSEDLAVEKCSELMTWLDPGRLPDSLRAQWYELAPGIAWRSLNTFGRFVAWSLLRKGRREKLKAAAYESCMYHCGGVHTLPPQGAWEPPISVELR
jgi:hypothetical protein